MIHCIRYRNIELDGLHVHIKIVHAGTCITSTINNNTQNINLQCVLWSLHGWPICSKSPDYYKVSIEANNTHLPLLPCSWWGLKFLDPLIVMALLLILLPLHHIICVSCDLHHMIHTIRSCDPQSWSITQMHIISSVFYTIGHSNESIVSHPPLA